MAHVHNNKALPTRNMLLASHHAKGVLFSKTPAEKRWRAIETLRMLREHLTKKSKS